MLYLLLVILYSVLMFGAYVLLLKDRKWYAFSRVYLIASAIAPLALPFVRLHGIAGTVPAVTLPAINVAARAGAAIVSIHIWSWFFSKQSYTLIVVILALELNNEWVRLRTIASMFAPVRIGKALVLCNTGMGPGSWRRYIFLPGENDNPAILEHELAHVQMKHSYELALLRILNCIVWPNFILYFIIRELKMVHEFQADSYAAQKTPGYTSALLNEVFGTKQFPMIHTFFHHPIKRRIMMLNKKATGKAMYVLAIGMSVLLVSGIVWAQNVSSGTTAKVQSGKHNVYDAVDIDKAPNPGYDLNKFLSENLKYPKQAIRDSIEGMVMVKFIVDQQGVIRDVKVVKSPSPALSVAALDAINKMPPWKPGENKGKKVDVSFFLPVVFQLP